MSTGWQQVKATWTFSAWEAVKVRNVFKTGRGGGKTLIHGGITWINRLLSTLPAFLLGPWRLWGGALAWQAHLRRLHLLLPGCVLCQGMTCLPQPAKTYSGSFVCWKNCYGLAHLELVFIVTENWDLLKKFLYWENYTKKVIYAICVWFCFLWPSRRKLQLTWGFIWCHLFT